MSTSEWIADGLRGRPDVSLKDYAASRGLAHFDDNMAHMGYTPAFPMTRDLQHNVMRGTLPGGEQGILYHEVKLYDSEETRGTFYGQKVWAKPKAKDFLALTGLTSSPRRYFKCPHTTSAIRLPSVHGLLVGLDVGRRKERVLGGHEPGLEKENRPGFDTWLGYRMDEVDPALEDWLVAWRGYAQREVVDEVVGGPIRELLTSREHGLGLRVSFHFGVLIVTQQHFAKTPEELDLLAQTASWLAQSLRSICAAHAEPLEFDAELPEPRWTPALGENPNAPWPGTDGQDYQLPPRIAAERGMASEDPFAFHRAFPWLPVPGEAIGVLRGTLPGTSSRGRLVTGIDRPMFGVPDGWDRVLERMPSGGYGLDTVILPLRPGTPDAHDDVGEVAMEKTRYAIRRGLLVMWRARHDPPPDGAQLDALTADADRVAREQGLL